MSYRDVVRVSENMSVKSDWKLSLLQMRDDIVTRNYSLKTDVCNQMGLRIHYPLIVPPA